MEFGGDLVYVGAPEDDEIPEYDDIDEEEEDMLNPQNEDEEVCRFTSFIWNFDIVVHYSVSENL